VTQRLAATVLLAVLALALSGCCSVWAAFCREEPPRSPPRFTRDTPQEAVDFLVDAFQNRRVREVYDSLHPDFVREQGGFSRAEFASGYGRIESHLTADAARIQAARRSDTVWRDGLAFVYVESADMSVWLAFQNRPATQVKAEDPDFGPVEVASTLEDLAAAIEVSSGGVFVTAPARLEGHPVDPDSVVRVAFHHDWLLRHVMEPRNVRFVERLRELSQ
jgi:hypothetical protein